MIDAINRACNTIGGLLMRPFEAASPWLALGAMALLLAVVTLLAFKFCSDQAALRRRRDTALARLLELHLFQDDVLGVFGASGRILAALARYLLESLKPLAVALIPMGLLLVQLAGWFECRPLKPGEAALLTVRVDPACDLAEAAFEATPSEGIEVEAGPFVSTRHHDVAWRIRPTREVPAGWVDLRVQGVGWRKSVSAASGRLIRASRGRVRGGLWTRLLHPFEPPLPADGPAVAIEVDYPASTLTLGAHRVPWLVALFVIALLFGAVLKYPMRVEF